MTLPVTMYKLNQQTDHPAGTTTAILKEKEKEKGKRKERITVRDTVTTVTLPE
jgi:hypothetical protein